MPVVSGHEFTRLEKISTTVLEDASTASRVVADEIAQLIRSRAKEGKNCVLGLATGSTPTGVYDQLVQMHKKGKLSFANVITFNLDEYFPMDPQALQSYVRFMNEHLFSHIDIDPANIHIPDGQLKAEQVPEFCQKYEQAIEEAGGLDLQILGIGRTGHIGFNEPGSGDTSRTRMIWLDNVTRVDAASDFFSTENVPYRAITMGVGSILKARRIVMMAFGESKSSIVAKAIEGKVTSEVAASYLQNHDNAQVYLDRPAADALTRFKSPWVLGNVKWDDKLTSKAVTWLARKLQKPLLKLTDKDYNSNELQSLVAEHGPAYNINLHFFRKMQRTITGWPGGKPQSAKKPGDVSWQGDDIFPKRVLIFSPHPDDDVISMGGTLLRLVDQGHQVHVAYQVSGNIAVSDDDAIRFADFMTDCSHLFNMDAKRSAEIEQHIETFLKNKAPGQVDSPEVRKIKGLIRVGEARAAGRYCGIDKSQLHFLDMPFYETGRTRKSPLSNADVKIIIDLLEKVKPHQIYAAGDLADPHGTHRTCLHAIHEALQRVRKEKWFDDCNVWLYRGAWQEWEPQQIEMAVPISPEELLRKRKAIFKHESQKDKALFPGMDPREFWQRAEDRNRETARLYDQLGLAEYEGIEGFVSWDLNEITFPRID